MFRRGKQEENPEDVEAKEARRAELAGLVISDTTAGSAVTKHAMDETLRLGVNIFGATDLPSADRFGKSDAYVIAQFMGKPATKKVETHVLSNENNPRWDHRDIMTGFMPGDTLEFIVNDKDGKSSTLLGKARLRSKEFYPGGFRGKLSLSEGLCSKSRKQALLEVQIYEIKKIDTSKEDKKAQKELQKQMKEKRTRERPSLGGYDNSNLPGTPPTPEGYDGYGLHGGQRRRDPFAAELSEYYNAPTPKSGKSPVTGDEWKLSVAVVKLQRWWRNTSYSVLSKRLPVRLPPSPEDDQDQVPAALVPTPVKRGMRGADRHQAMPADPAWHARLGQTANLVKGAASSTVSRRCSVQLTNMQEHGKFVCACRVAAVLAVQSTMLDPHGTYPAQTKVQEEEGRDKLPRRITRDDPLWPHVRPRFDGDRVFVHDSIVLTIIGGSVVGDADFETAWRIYSHDLQGLQALTDVIMAVDCVNPIAPAVAAVVDYLGFRVICRPQTLFVGSRPPELVIGPISEAPKAYSGPGDLPELYRTAQGSRRTELSLLVNTWEEHHQDLRLDLDCIARNLRLQGLPIVLDVTDLPDNCESTALVRIGSELHFRTPAELLPPEILTDAGLADPTRRLRKEALDALNAPALPLTHRMSSYMTDVNGDDGLGPQRLQAFSLYAAKELPKRFLERLEAEGPPLDSRGWTETLHASGLNCRHIGWVAASASTAAAAALHREALARTVKWIFRHRLRRRVPWALIAGQNVKDTKLTPEEVAAREVINIFNLTLGSGDRSYRFWNEELIPETVRRFGVSPTAIERGRIFPGALFFALQYHVKVRFRKTAESRSLFHVGLEEPFHIDDLLPFRSSATQTFFPHIRVVQQRLQMLQNRFMGIEDGTREAAPLPQMRGFAPEVRIICARGPEWLAAVHTPARHVRDGRWDRAYEALNLRLSMTRAIGDPAAAVGGALQGIAVALLKLSKAANPEATTEQNQTEFGEPIKKGPGKALMDRNRARQAMWAAEGAFKMLPNSISSWWSQLAALEAEWLLGRHVQAELRMQRLNAHWNRFAADQPMLQLKLQDTIARLMGTEGDWTGASAQLKECVELAEHAFGRTHPATISYLARLGDSLVRQQAWQPAVHVFRQALALCETAGDQTASARIGYELANALHRSGDVAGAKAHAENVVWTVLPRLHSQVNTGNATGMLRHTAGGAFALDALHLLARIYEDIFLRSVQLPNGAGLSAGDRLEVAQRSISCYEALLRQLPMMVNDGSGQLSREGQVVESILRMKTLTTGHDERVILEDAIESLIVSSSIAQDPDVASMKGVRALQPKVQTRSIAAAALRTSTSDLESRINALCEAVARDAALNGLGPAAWFDRILSHLSSGGYWGLTELNDPMHQSTLQLLDLCRHFMGNSLKF